jgi:zinc transport system substrate-binding protein
MVLTRRTALAGAAAATAALLLRPLAGAAEEAPWAVASIKPIHSLLSGVMAGVGTPALLVKGYASPHSYALKPSDAALLEQARILFWVGPALERFLMRPLETLGADADLVELLQTDGLTRFAVRQGGLWQAHQHAEPLTAADTGTTVDGHIWLDPVNAKAIVRRMALELSAVDPERAPRYAENAEALGRRLDALDAELAATLAPVAARPFIVFHDAYQYFEARYGLTGAGSITLDPDQPPGAERLAAIQARLAGAGALCVFHEPQFPTALIETVTRGTGARVGELDPEGAALADGPELYFSLLRDIAAALTGCLGG